jgi:hypothetical protein
MSEYTGYESAFVPTPAADASSPNVERKTAPPSGEAKPAEKLTQKYKLPVESNVLNGYRSITYNFTLAALPSDYVSNPDVYRKAEMDLVILKSGGKGNNTILNVNKLSNAQVSATEEPVLDKYSAKNNQAKLANKLTANQGLITGFNEKSPGRFDMFIDDVEIETIMSFSEESNVTQPTKIKFDVFEPYSINGFIEALHVAAVAAGYTSYINASFVLKLEFWGIPDSDNEIFKAAEKIPNADRYFPIGLTNVEVDITERGTKYQCSAVPYNERAFGQPSVVKKPIKMEGKSVKEILTNFVKSFNEQLKKSNEDAKLNPNNVDTYNIKFVEWDANNGWIDAVKSKIGDSDLLNLYEDNVLYKFAKPNDGKNAYKPGTEPKSIKYNPTGAAINFPENISVHEVISAVIKDSVYVRKLLEDMASSDKSTAKARVDEMGRVEYFSIKVEVKNRDVFDETAKKPYQEFTFVVSPFKVHFTRIPRYGQVQLKEEEFAKLVLREYNYYYMGKNVDVLNFKLNFNTLYFEAIPAAMADQNVPNYRDSAKPDGRGQPKIDAPSKQDQTDTNPSHPPAPVRQVPVDTKPNSGSATPIQNDPYAALARSMHDAVVNSKASMVTGNIEILGDPFYLVTGGMGSYNPKPVSGSREGVVGQKEVAMNYAEVNILINFRNPIDIGSFESGGLMIFDPNRVPFSGVYMVTKAMHTFKEGSFKQNLEIIRRPGQILDGQGKEVKMESLTKVVPNPENAPVSAEAPEVSVQRVSTADVAEYLSRGAPNVESNFTAAVGGLGGGESVLTRTYGLVSRDGVLQSAAGIIGQALPTVNQTDIRLNVTQLANLGNSNLTSAGLINAAANIITGNTSLKNVASTMAGTIIGNTLNQVLQKSNVGSGIGEGASVLIPPLSTIPLNPTALDIKAGALENPLALAKDAISNVKGEIQQLGQNALDQVNRLGDKANLLVGGVGAKISESLGSKADPKAIAAQLGLDSSKLSGISNNLQSKLPKQLTDILKNTPENLNLSQALDQGIALSAIPPSKFGNIPPLTPFRTAPDALPDISSPLIKTTVAAGIASTLNSVDTNAIKDKMSTVKSQLSKLSSIKSTVDQKVSGSVGAVFGSKASTSPLETLLNNFKK